MTVQLTYSEFEKRIEEAIRTYVEENDIPDYTDENSPFNYVDGLVIASEITLDFYTTQDAEGIKIIPDKK